MLSAVEKVLFLMRAPVTSDASTDALARLASVAHEVEVALGQRLFTLGDQSDAVWVVLDGAVRIEGIEVPSRLAGPGDFIGGLALFSDGAQAATAVTAVTTRLLRIDRADLHDLLDEDGEFARALFSGLMRTLRLTAPSLFAA
ncbi:MAG TPA: Crp/Fnr family transcriptional regulator [Polyangia bacterium]|nr:Crp/Fnr family transcriptional regulator [Polyangia bacterium]